MKKYSTSLFCILLLTPISYAAHDAFDDQTQLPTAPAKPENTPYFQSPPESSLPDNAFGKLIKEGRELFMNTKKQAPHLVGNEMNCRNCHLDQGRMANSSPLWAAYVLYPAYRKKNDKVNSFAERMQGCFVFSMNGTEPAVDSHEINALTAYSYWLATGAPVGKELPGRGYPEIPQPAKGYDINRGEKIYAAQCALCHGDDGQGQKAADTYVFPPLWGKNAYNWGAGMHRINTAAGFIKANMPLGLGFSLSDEEAWDVAAFINSHERPQDPRLVEGSIEKTRLKYHANDGVNLYGQIVNGILLGQGTK